MRIRPSQLTFHLDRPHGGRRKGAGRPNRSGLQAHVRRPRLERRHPLHVTLHLSDELRGVRRKDLVAHFRQAIRKARLKGLRVAHFSLLSNHLHLLLEPAELGHGLKTSRALQSFAISFARRLNSAVDRSGAVFRERYHLHVLRTPTEVRRALVYVLTNEGKHQGTEEVALDPFSSAYAFRRWRELLPGKRALKFRVTSWNEDLIEGWLNWILSEPETWLLREGWRRSRAI